MDFTGNVPFDVVYDEEIDPIFDTLRANMLNFVE
jgi:hypothetical protein